MPFPLNQKTNRFSTGATFLSGRVSAAYAVPAELNIETSGGNPSTTAVWVAVIPVRKRLRDNLTRLVITFGI